MAIHLHRWEQTNHLFWTLKCKRCKRKLLAIWIWGQKPISNSQHQNSDFRLSKLWILEDLYQHAGRDVCDFHCQSSVLAATKQDGGSGWLSNPKRETCFDISCNFDLPPLFEQICGTIGTITSVDSSSLHFFRHVQLIYFESFRQNSSPGSIYLLWRCLGNLKSILWIHSVTQSFSIFRLEELPPRNSKSSPRAVVVVYKWLVAVRDKVLPLGSFSQSRKVQQLQSGILFIQTLTCVWLWNIFDSACRPATRRGATRWLRDILCIYLYIALYVRIYIIIHIRIQYIRLWYYI